MAKQNNTVLAVLAHILGLFTGFIGPLVILLVASGDAFGLKSAKSALNWQFSLIIYMIVSGILTFVFIGVPLMFILGILNIVFSIIGTIKASNGEMYKYPLSIKFFKI